MYASTDAKDSISIGIQVGYPRVQHDNKGQHWRRHIGHGQRCRNEQMTSRFISLRG
ncbi:hypothetical protein AG1IA_07079 [Rhizoctonia solani AG-1 IA]|uniref:Uncharacterized protein n=1 Tax=Thanatephorus cucumeris (strain AG1-IA) TaxID=983506 RepID=L8WQ39_THACA|nr:hypothetical protein AG1IA_07079 [Rhizoctonia solani AG-1 IA]